MLAMGLLVVPFALIGFSKPQTGPEFVAFDGARGTPEMNKRYIVPYKLTTRKPRQVSDQPGNILQEPGSHWNGYTWMNDSGDLLFEDVEIYGNYTWASNLFRNGDTLAERPGKYTWRNIFVTAAPGNVGMKWGTREWNTPQREFIDCDFFAIPKEHGLYISVYEGTLIDGCTFIRMGSQGIQIVHRTSGEPPYGVTGDNRPYAEKPLHILRDSHFIDCAQGGSRPSYNASYFNPGSSEFPGTLLIEDCSFVCKWVEPEGYYNSLSTGALVVAPMDPEGPLESNFMELLQVKNCLFDFTRGNRGIANIRATDTVIFEDCCFIARDHSQPHINIDKNNANMGNGKTQRIIFRNCIGIGGVTVKVHVGPDLSQTVSHDINTLGQELIIDGITGQIISSGSYN